MDLPSWPKMAFLSDSNLNSITNSTTICSTLPKPSFPSHTASIPIQVTSLPNPLLPDQTAISTLSLLRPPLQPRTKVKLNCLINLEQPKFSSSINKLSRNSYLRLHHWWIYHSSRLGQISLQGGKEARVGVRKQLENCSRIQMGYSKDKGRESDIRQDITNLAVLNLLLSFTHPLTTIQSKLHAYIKAPQMRALQLNNSFIRTKTSVSTLSPPPYLLQPLLLLLII